MTDTEKLEVLRRFLTKEAEAAQERIEMLTSRGISVGIGYNIGVKTACNHALVILDNG